MRESDSDRLVNYGFVIATLVLATIGIVSYRNTARVQSSTDERAAAREARLVIETLHASLFMAEASQRDFLVGQNPDSLSAFEKAATQLPQYFVKLDHLMVKYAEQVKRVDRLRALVEGRIAELRRSAQAEQRGDHAAAVAIGRNNGPAHERIEALIREISSIQAQEVERRAAQANEIRGQSGMMTFFGLAAALSLAIAVFALSLRNQRKRALAEAENNRIRRDIEARVAQLGQVTAAQLAVAGGSLEVGRTLATIAEETMTLTEAEGATVERLDVESMEYIAAAGSAAPHIGFRLKAEGSLSGLCILERRLLTCSDSETDPRVNREACRKVNLRSMIVIPLFHNGKPLGVLKAVSSKPNAFTPFHENGLHLVAGILSASWGHAIDFDEKKAMIAELERAQADLKAAKQRADDATAAKSAFLAKMTHEIRTPMNGIVGMTGILAETPLNDEQRSFVSTVSMSANALLAIVNDILDFSKIEAGKMRFEMLDFDLRSTLEETLELISFSAHNGGIELIQSISPLVPLGLRGDQGRLRQVVLNLLSNAVKFTPCGEVALSAECLEDTKDSALIRISVRDTGVGIPEHVLPRLFHAFSQADDSTSRKFGGTGLGLVISRELVKRMNGEIGVESKVGMGTTFWFTARFEKQRTKTEETNAVLDGMKVLVIENNRTHREVLVKQLVSWGVKCAACDTQQSAATIRALAADVPFGVVIAEDMTFCATLPAEAWSSDAYFIHMSKVGGPQQPVDAKFAARIFGQLYKPVKQSQLYDTLVQFKTGVTAMRKSAVQQKPESLHRGRILVAEDNSANQKIMLIQLSKLGYRADVAANGIEVITALRNFEYDLVLMDCQMPEMDGYEATRRIRQSGERFASLPVIAMTANALEGDREICLAAGMDDYLAKPVTLGTLRGVLERWVKKSKAAA